MQYQSDAILVPVASTGEISNRKWQIPNNTSKDPSSKHKMLRYDLSASICDLDLGI